MEKNNKKFGFLSRKGAFSLITTYFQSLTILIPFISIFLFNFNLQAVLISLLATIWMNFAIAFKTKKMFGFKVSKKALTKIGIYVLVLSFLIFYQIYFFGSSRIVLAQSGNFCPGNQYPCSSSYSTGGYCYYSLTTACWSSYSPPDTCAGVIGTCGSGYTYCFYTYKCQPSPASCPTNCSVTSAGSCTSSGCQPGTTSNCPQGYWCSGSSCINTGYCGYSNYNKCGGVGSPCKCQRGYDAYRCDGNGNCNYDVGDVWENVAYAYVCCSNGNQEPGGCGASCGFSEYYACVGDGSTQYKCERRRDCYACNGAGACNVDVGDFDYPVSMNNVCNPSNPASELPGSCTYACGYSAYRCTNERYKVRDCYACNGAGACNVDVGDESVDCGAPGCSADLCDRTYTCSGGTCGSYTTPCPPNTVCFEGSCSSGPCGTSSCPSDSCSGSCPGCTWRDYPASCNRYCDGAGNCESCSCSYTSYDPDSASSYCTGCGQSWNIGGEVAATTCCGDDSGEYKRTRSGGTDAPTGYTTDSNDDACCNANNKCVKDSVCVASGSTYGTIPTKAYCDAGTWKGGDAGQTMCDAIVGSGNWFSSYSSGSSYPCCGDDGSSDFFENSGSGNSACVQGEKVSHDSISSTNTSYLVFNGELFYCKEVGGPNSEYSFVTSVNPGTVIGSWKCAYGVWSSGVRVGLRGGRITIIP